MKYNSDFRYDLEIGQEYESRFADLFRGKKFEVKTDFHSHKTGNIAIEYKSRGKPSGISTTESDFYVYIIPMAPLKNIMIILPVNELKEITKKKAKEGFIKSIGDNNTSECVLIPIMDLFRI
jgi:hypothetical protein